jgi:hypothetical protein
VAKYVVEVALDIKVPAVHSARGELAEYHWYENMEVPPDSCEVRVTDCPLSMDGAEGVIAPAERVGFTVT